MKQILFPIFFIVVIPHLILYKISRNEEKRMIDSDIKEMNKRIRKNHSLAYYLIMYQSYRNLFYFRIGKKSSIVSWYMKPYPLFFIHPDKLGANAFVLNHPYGTILNAKSIGNNFTCCQLTTIGNKQHGKNSLRPTIGDNVSIGANVSIIGDITIGNNVIIGAGSVVVKNIPDNCIVAGCPATIIRYL